MSQEAGDTPSHSLQKHQRLARELKKRSSESGRSTFSVCLRLWRARAGWRTNYESQGKAIFYHKPIASMNEQNEVSHQSQHSSKREALPGPSPTLSLAPLCCALPPSLPAAREGKVLEVGLVNQLRRSLSELTRAGRGCGPSGQTKQINPCLTPQ